jgi:hypothetical protein
MTDRVHALTVVLEKEIREDDIQALIDAIKMMRCVLDVQTHVTDIDFYTAREQARAHLTKQLWNVLHPDNKIKE